MVEIIEAASTGDYSFYKTHHAPEKIYLQLLVLFLIRLLMKNKNSGAERARVVHYTAH